MFAGSIVVSPHSNGSAIDIIIDDGIAVLYPTQQKMIWMPNEGKVKHIELDRETMVVVDIGLTYVDTSRSDVLGDICVQILETELEVE